jgi:hypothetical protein
MITYHRGILYSDVAAIDEVYIVYTGKYNVEHRTIHVLIDGKKESILFFSNQMFIHLVDILKEGEEQLIRCTNYGIEVINVYTWWFPNSFIEPKRVFTKIVGDTRELTDGTRINFSYDSREKAIESEIRHCEERMEFYKNRLKHVNSLVIDTVQPAAV